MVKKAISITDIVDDLYDENQKKHEVIKTDIKSLDYILGGGIELGSKIQFVAESSTGKSTLALHICRNMCKKKYNVVYIDTENSISNELLASTGCEKYCNALSNEYGSLVLIKESDFNSVCKILDKCLITKQFHFIIIDSLANLVNNCYVDIETSKDVKEITNYNTNYESRPLNLFINKYSSLANKYNVAMLYINQFRNKIDPVKGTILKEYGSKIVRYNSDIIIKIKKEKESYAKDENGMLQTITSSQLPATHNMLSFIVDKSNKLLTGTSVNTFIEYGHGIDETIDNILYLMRNNVIKQNGKYYTICINNQEGKVDGFCNLINYVKSNIDKFNIEYFGNCYSQEQYDDKNDESIIIYDSDDGYVDVDDSFY